MKETWAVRLPTWLGDTLMALPVLRAIHRSCERTVLWGPPAYRDLLAAVGLTADYLPYRRRRGLAGLLDATRAVAELRRFRAGAALLLPNAFEPALLSKLARIPRRVGYATDGRRFLLTDVVPEKGPRHAVHEADRFAHIAEHAGFTITEADGRRLDGAQLDDRAAAILPPGSAYLGIVAGSANDPAKRWPAADYARLIDLFHSRSGAQPLLLGSVADRRVNDRIGALCEAEPTNLSGGSLIDLAAIMSRCRMVIGNDTGGSHLAAALGRPTAVVFRSTDPARTCPRGDHVVALSTQTPARVFAQLEPMWRAGE